MTDPDKKKPKPLADSCSDEEREEHVLSDLLDDYQSDLQSDGTGTGSGNESHTVARNGPRGATANRTEADGNGESSPPLPPPVVRVTAEAPSFATRDIRLTDPAYRERMQISSTRTQPTSPPPPPPPQLRLKPEPVNGRNRSQRIKWHRGMTCPVPQCRNVAPFQNIENYLRHFQEVHQPLTLYYECPVSVGHFRVKRRGDLSRHLRKAHTGYSESQRQGLINRCPRTQRPNPAYINPGNLLPPLIVEEPVADPVHDRRCQSNPTAAVTPRNPTCTTQASARPCVQAEGGARPKEPTNGRLVTPMEVSSSCTAPAPRNINRDTGERTPARPRANPTVPQSVAGMSREVFAAGMFADVTQPQRWIPQDPDDIPSFLTWLAQFQAELEGVKEEARRRIVQEGGSTSLRRAYEEELARRRQADAEIARLRREVERQKKNSEKRDKDRDDKESA